MSREEINMEKREIRKKYVEKIVRICAEITLSKQVDELFELAKTNMVELEKKVDEFTKSSLYHKIQKLDKSLKVKPIFKGQYKSNREGLVEFDTRINPKALFFLIVAMDCNTEDSFFEDQNDFVVYLKRIGEEKLANYVAKNWLYSTISRTLWDVYDDDD